MSDNKSALSMIHDPIQHALTKHIDMDRNFIQERIEEKTLCTPYIPFEYNCADMFTKGVTKPHLSRFLTKLKVENIRTACRGGVNLDKYLITYIYLILN